MTAAARAEDDWKQNGSISASMDYNASTDEPWWTQWTTPGSRKQERTKLAAAKKKASSSFKAPKGRSSSSAAYGSSSTSYDEDTSLAHRSWQTDDAHVNGPKPAKRWDADYTAGSDTCKSEGGHSRCRCSPLCSIALDFLSHCHLGIDESCLTCTDMQCCIRTCPDFMMTACLHTLSAVNEVAAAAAGTAVDTTAAMGTAEATAALRAALLPATSTAHTTTAATPTTIVASVITADGGEVLHDEIHT